MTIFIPPSFGVSYYIDCLNQMSSILVAKSWTTSSNDSTSWIDEVFEFLMNWMRSLINWFSLPLPLISEHHLVGVSSSLIGISTVIRAWSDESLQSRWIWCQLNSIEEGWVKMRSKTKFEFWLLSKNLVGRFSIGLDKAREKESTISNSISVKTIENGLCFFLSSFSFLFYFWFIFHLFYF